ncbi:MAG: hypothetical protein ACKPJJ_13575, partial [Planctomycetaceae bacterium]
SPVSRGRGEEEWSVVSCRRMDSREAAKGNVQGVEWWGDGQSGFPFHSFLSPLYGRYAMAS